MFRFVQKPVPFLGIAAIVVVVPLWWRMHFAPHVASAPTAIEVSGIEKLVMFNRAGLDVRSLAAAGVSPNSISASVLALDTYLSSHATTLSSADTAVATARKESDRLLRLIQSGNAGEQDVTDYQTQKNALATATTQQAAALDAIFEAATANLSQQQHTTLSAIRGNSANEEVSVEFRTISRSKADWMQLRDDLAAERILAHQGEEPFVPGQERLATARANETVAAAKTALDTNLASITTALASATSDH
jgi:hypothetical protein